MLHEAVHEDGTTQGGTCPVGVLISGGVPHGSSADVPLEPDDREYLASACCPGSRVVLAKLWRALDEQGYKVGATALGRHRRRDCRCR